MAMGGLDMLARIYWYTVEFGLIDNGQGLRAFGACRQRHCDCVTGLAVADPGGLTVNFRWVVFITCARSSGSTGGARWLAS